jgi:fatty acid omega-hydroxylase
MRPIKEGLARYFTPWNMSTKDHVAVIDKFAEDVIAQRRKEIAEGVEGHKDLLSRFMNTHNENGEKLNDVELRDTVLNFIIAGRDTTGKITNTVTA